MNLMVSEIIKKAAELPRAEAVQFLRNNKSVPLMHLLKMGLCKTVRLNLPPGAPPYEPSPLVENTGMFMSEARKLYLFVDGQSPDIHPIKRETLFINMLQAIHPEDALMLLAAKDKRLPIDAGLVAEAFPELYLEPVDQTYLKGEVEVAESGEPSKSEETVNKPKKPRKPRKKKGTTD